MDGRVTRFGKAMKTELSDPYPSTSVCDIYIKEEPFEGTSSFSYGTYKSRGTSRERRGEEASSSSEFYVKEEPLFDISEQDDSDMMEAEVMLEVDDTNDVSYSSASASTEQDSSRRFINELPSSEQPSSMDSLNMVITDGKFFRIIKDKCTAAQTVAVCVKCEPAVVEIKGFGKSSSNFLCHLKRKHGHDAVVEYDTYLKLKREMNKYQGRRQIMKCVRTNKNSQNDFEQNIMKFVLKYMTPLNIVENPEFKNIFNNLQISSKGIKMMSRQTLCRKMENSYFESVQRLMDKLKNVKYVCTTTDIWSGGCKSFLLVTVHWVKENMERESAALACKRFRNSYTSERITKMVNDIYSYFGLHPTKISATVIDNINDFRKAFRLYGVKDRNIGNGEAMDDELNVCDSDSQSDFEWEDYGSLSPNISSLSKAKNLSMLSPKHVKFCSNTLYLCASTDICKVISDSQKLSTIHNSVMGKCNILWRAASYTKSADIIQNILGYSFIRPNGTRWNSLYDALQSILRMKDKCGKVFQALKLKNKITEEEFKYLEEHLDCTKPIADALDILQGEKYMYYGTLVSVLFALRPKLEKFYEKKWEFCHPIVECLINSVSYRFNDLFNFSTTESLNAAIAAVSHPEFKNRWMSQIPMDIQNKIMQSLKDAVAVESSSNLDLGLDSSNSQGPSGQSSVPSDFFDFGEENATGEVATELQVLQYLNDNCRNLKMLERYPEIKRVFIKYNTTLPSSAAMERLFSFTPMSHLSETVSDKNFEIRVLMKANSRFYT